MSVPFLHKFRSQMQSESKHIAALQSRTSDWPLSMIGPDGAQLLSFDILGIGEEAPRKPGIFVYAKRIADLQWQALYIGETANLRNRLAFNEIAADALLSGATDIHVLVLDVDTQARRDLCEKFVFTNRPPLNEDARARLSSVTSAKSRVTKKSPSAA